MIDTDLLQICNIKKTENVVAIKMDEVIKLRTGLDYPLSSEPISIPKFLQQAVSKYSNRPALAFRENGNKWNLISYKEYHEKVLSLAKVFIKLGLQPRTSVGILAFNCPEWHYAEMATIHAGGIVAGIYITNSTEAIYHNLNIANATIVIVGDQTHMEKIKSIKHRLPTLKTVIQINGPFDDSFGNEDGFYKWSDIEKIDANNMEDELSMRLSEIAVNECCCLVFTSGTVGFPKAVMLSHDCLTWNSSRIADAAPKLQSSSKQNIFISYLPMSHMAAQIFDVFLPIIEGGCVYFADKDALKDTLLNTIQQARPTRFLAVPRLWEKLQENLISAEKKSSRIYQMLLRWSRNVVLNHNQKVMKGEHCSCWQYWFARKIIQTMISFSGFDRCQWFITGAAPTSPETKEYFLSLDIKLFEVYGMSETSGVISLGDEFTRNFETVGKILPGIQVKIDNANETGRGEICIKTRSTFMGYLNQLDKTKELLDEDDWLHSGDYGYVDNEGYLYVTGRLKELIITSGGENIPTIYVENLVKKELPGISNAVLVGDKRKFLSMLLTIKTESDPDTGVPCDKLHADAIEWMKNLNLQYKNLSDILNAGPCSVVLESIQQGINRANQNAISNAQKVKKFAILPHDFSIATNELGSTLKIKRNFILTKYKDIIDAFYN